MRILVIEDEAKTAAYLRQGLTESGFTVEVCVNGEDGLRQALAVDNDLIILDVMFRRNWQNNRGPRPAVGAIRPNQRSAASFSFWSRFSAARINPMWLSACGKLPRCSPPWPSCSA